MKKNQQKKNGFSLIEVVVVLAVLSVSITSMSILMANNIRSSRNAKNQAIASALAQEGIELVRNLKDNYTAAGTGNFSASGISTRDYQLDKTMSAFGTGAIYSLILDGNNFYVYGSDGTEKFYRKISIDITTAGQTKVTSYAWWTIGGIFPNDPSNGKICNVANSCVSIVSVLLD